MPANYDNAAWFYDRLQRLVYGRQLLKAQVFLLKHIPAGSRVLIAGGGTGSILDELTRLQSSGLSITYVELSANMVELSRRRNQGQNSVEFVVAAAEEVTTDQPYDVIITPFLFDNFTENGMQQLFGHLHQQLKTGGLWLHADFQLTGRWWQPLLLKAMYRFFHVLGCVDVNRLPDTDVQFSKNNYQLVAQKTFWGDFVQSTVYSKP